MVLREISFKDLIKPIEDPSENYPFNPKPISPYSNKISYSDWDYHKKKRKSLEYDTPKPFSGSYDGGGSYAFSSPKSSSGSYKIAA